jgi:hypothetical protein
MSENEKDGQLSAAGTNLPTEPSKADDAAAGSSLNVTEPAGQKSESKDEKSQE